MRKGLLIAVGACLLLASNVEARDNRGGQGGQHHGAHGQPQKVVVVNKDKGHGRGDVRHGGKHNNVVVVNRDYYRPAPIRTVSYVSQPVYVVPQPASYVVYNEPVYYPASPIQSVFFSNRNFSFGFSNFLW